MFDWQFILVLLIVAVAAGYVGRVVWKSISTSSGGVCSSCDSCGNQDAAPSVKPLVTLDEGQFDGSDVRT